MVPVMRRTFALVPVIGLFGAALGCQHIGGKHDCGAHPSDAVIAPASNPYPFAPVGGVVMPTIPPANGKDVIIPPKKVGNESGSLPMLETDLAPSFKNVPQN